MKPEDYARKQFVIEGVEGVNVSTEWINPDYTLNINVDAVTNAQGRLQFVRILPKDKRMPEFVARIGHDDQGAVDIDLIGEPADRKAFARRNAGYIGHRTDRLSSNPPTYKIEIHVPTIGHVFTGALTLRIANLGARLGDSDQIRDDFQASKGTEK